MVVNGAGTGGRGRIVGYDVGGKTGTAQVISNQGKARAAGDRDLRDHGWFVFFAPAKNPTIAGVVFAEHAEHGFFAAPIAKYMMETWFAKQEGRPLPTLAPLPGSAGEARSRSTPPRIAVSPACPRRGEPDRHRAAGRAGRTVRSATAAASEPQTRDGRPRIRRTRFGARRPALRRESRYSVPGSRAGARPDSATRDCHPGVDPMFEQRLYKHLDWSLLGAVLLLCGFGLVMIYSTTTTRSGRASAASSTPSCPPSASGWWR